jgi:hypothetical protein
MAWLTAPDCQVARLLLERGIAVVDAIAFIMAIRQFPALCGRAGSSPRRASWRRSHATVAPSLNAGRR